MTAAERTEAGRADAEQAEAGHADSDPFQTEAAETEQAVVEAARSVLAAAGAAVGGPEPGGPQGSSLWNALRRAGLLGLAAPSELGGEGLGPAAVLTLLTELGRAGQVGPAPATLALGGLLAARWGSPEQQRLLLGPVLDVGALLTAAVREPSDPIPSTVRPAPPRTTAGTDLVVTGVKIAVPYAEQAHRILVPVTLPTGSTALAVIAATAPGVGLHRTPTSAGTPEYTVRLTGARAEALLGDPDRGHGGADDPGGGILADLCRIALAQACAVADGLVQGALALTAAHVAARHQFGRPLAAFQSVAQQVADVYLTARTLHLATRSAVHRLSQRPGGAGAAGRDVAGDVDRELAIAAYWVARYGPPALRTCHHLHGGLGLDVSYPLHTYSAALKDLVRFVGSSEQALQRLALLDDAAPTPTPTPSDAAPVPGGVAPGSSDATPGSGGVAPGSDRGRANGRRTG